MGLLRRRSAIAAFAVVVIFVSVLLSGCDETVLTNQQHAFLWQKGVMTDLGTLGGTSSLAYGISPSGQVTGWAQTGAGDVHAFSWYRGTMTDLGTLGGTKSVGRDINKQGQIVGWSTTSSGYERAFLWYRGRMIDLGTLGGNESRAYGIDDLGDVVGWARTLDGSKHAVLWSGKTITDLGTIADIESQAFAVQFASESSGRWWQRAVTVVGSQGVGSPVAAIWKNGQAKTIGAFATGQNSKAYGINFNGQVVGEADTDPADDYPHPFLWSKGVMQDLGILSGTTWGRAYAINSQGDCAGECVYYVLFSTSPSFAVAWIRGQIIDLGHLPGGTQAVAYDINDKQQVVGTSEYSLVPVAPPVGLSNRLATLALAGIQPDSVVAVRLVGTDASGQTVYDYELSGAALQRAIAGAQLDPAPPAGTTRLTAEVTYLDAAGAQQSTTFDCPLF